MAPVEFERDPDARELWATIEATVPSLILAGADGPALVMLCRIWSEWRKVDRALMSKRPTDKKYGPLLKLSLALEKQWHAIACRFGLLPTERAKLRLPPTSNEPKDPLDQLQQKRGG